MTETQGATRRIVALDALRAFAMILIVVEHAAVAYMQTPLARLAWPVLEPADDRWMDRVLWFGRSFHVPVFFLVAGVFSAMTIQRKGADGYIRSRLSRLGVPFLAGVAFVLPLMYLVWCWGWNTSGLMTLDDFREFRIPDAYTHDVFGPAHLWFLQFLIAYCCLLWAWNARVPAAITRHGAALAGLIAAHAPVRLFMPLAASAAVLTLAPEAVLEFHNGMLPHPGRFAHYGVFFVVGVMVWPVLRDRAAALSRGWWLMLGLSIPVFVVLDARIAALQGEMPGTWEQRFAIGGLFALFGWLSAWGWLGAFLVLVRGLGKVGAFLLDASYWVYLTHLPWLGIAAVLLYGADVPPWVKFLAVTAVSFGVTLLTYPMAKKSPLGRYISGSLPERSGAK